ncbi:MAG: DUF4419 domain-containing protein [Bacteroidota bacterium]|nr:DUF4419 domain-containing protein [Bacteroidota bacterium]
MKKFILLAVLLTVTLNSLYAADAKILHRDKQSITFVVDENLPKPVEKFHNSIGRGISYDVLERLNFTNPKKQLVTSSFMNESFKYLGQDVFFQMMVEAFADHRSVVLSPDVIWLLISQQFSHYVNKDPEALRDKLVDHEGKLSLVVKSEKDLLAKDADWNAVIEDFSRLIKANTKGNVAEMITANFSTTQQTERLASEIVLMDAVKPYFEYIVMYIACGIPFITLQGTPADWKEIVAKTRKLDAYGLGWWTAELVPILDEFVKASEGHPNQNFWKDIVMKDRPDRLRGGGCSLEKPTNVDGWFLKFFPFDEKGRTPATIPHTFKMLPEQVSVGFQYIKQDDVTGKTLSNTPMELIAGIVGVEVNPETQALTPKIGWLTAIANNEKDVFDKLKKQNQGRQGIYLRVKEVPLILKELGHINHLYLSFTDKVVIPSWMDKMTIDRFDIEGELSESEKAELRKRFPNVKIVGEKPVPKTQPVGDLLKKWKDKKAE